MIKKYSLFFNTGRLMIIQIPEMSEITILNM